jgi:hypothetical protein
MSPPESRIQPTFVVERISPAKAGQYLEHNESNRKLSRTIVQTYAAEMQRGEWLMNAEAIKFDWNGRLVDGQHRLRAVIVSGRTLEFLVARNLDPCCFKTIDTGKIRNSADIMSLHGVAYPSAVATAYRLLWTYISRDKSKRRISNTQLIKFMGKHPDLALFAPEVMKRPLYVGPVLVQGTQIFAFYVMSRISEQRARLFFQCLARERADAPQQVAALRHRLIQLGSEVLPPTPTVKRAMLIHAWNHYIAERRIIRIPRTFERMPRFEPEPRL